MYELQARCILSFYVLKLAVSPLASRGFAPRGDPKKIKEKFVKGPRKSLAKKK